ncbi:MAG TPA: hypothetical protein ENN19_00225 [Chloroflexi bacterium]|nr:hypothetical protein [Chloroflexota bacterium]
MASYRPFYCLLIFCLLGGLLLGLSPLEGAEAQEAQTIQFSLKQLGYSDRVLKGPLTQARYYFSLPKDWQMQGGGYLILDLEPNLRQQEDYDLSTFEVRLNGEIVYREKLTRSETFQVQLNIPAAALSTTYANTLQLELQVEEECELARLTTMTVKASSSFSLVYSEKPLTVDLALYPEPFYQTSIFESKAVRLILPEQPDEVDIQAATMIVSRLGRLTGDSLTVSMTLASDVQPVSDFSEHLIVIGAPETMPLLHDLDLPISPFARRLTLQSEMPAEVAPGEIFSYTLRVINTENETRSLFVEDQLPAGAIWLSCSGNCQQSAPGVLRWQISNLVTGTAISTVIQVRLDEQAPLDRPLEHTATLFDSDGTPLNVDTLRTVATLTPTDTLTATSQSKGDYFFLRSERGVPETDGLVQEIVSPWNSRRALVVVTGLDEQALFKAAQALSSETRFPGMQGDYALVQDVRPVSDTLTIDAEELSFDFLGYRDVIVRGYQSSGAEYVFEFPWGWSLAQDAYAAIHFAHGFRNPAFPSTLEVQLNDVPIGGVPLEETNAVDAWLTIPLPNTPLLVGRNKLRLLVFYSPNRCLDNRDDQVWMTIYKDSFLYLPREVKRTSLDLRNFPIPFSRRPDLQDLVFVLPARPTAVEIEGVIRLAARLGSAARGSSFAPQVVLDEASTDLPWADANLIVVGRPTTNSYIGRWNDILPQPFYTGTDEIRQQIDDVIYRLSSQTSLGLVQLASAPWDEEQAILFLTGSTDEGVQWAINALTDRAPAWRLSGNLALAQDRDVRSVDTREIKPEGAVKLIATAMPAMTPQSTVASQLTETPLPTASPVSIDTTEAPATPTLSEQVAPAQAHPFWLIPLLIASIVVVVGASALVIWKSRA